MLNVMKLDRFAFMAGLINETENGVLNRKTVGNEVKRVLGHSGEILKVCMAEVCFAAGASARSL